MIDVLLVSPRLSPTDLRRCGDHAYTDLLLENPPPGVRYHHYEDLIENGRMRRVRFWQAAGYYLTQAGFLPPDTWAEYLESDFVPDLVHTVVFAVALRSPAVAKIPLVVHTSSPSITDLTVKRNWNRQQVTRAYRRKKGYLKLARAHHYALNAGSADKVLVQSEYGRNLILSYGDVAAEKVEVLYPAQPTPDRVTAVAKKNRETTTFLFVGTDFERKNGPMVVDAFLEVYQKYPNTRLILVGKPANGQKIIADGVQHLLFVPHEELLAQIFPQADVFLLPTRAEGSFAFTLFEAMSMGLPAITVNAWAMPEIIQQGKNGFLIKPDSRADLIQTMQRLVERQDVIPFMRQQSCAIFREKFSVEAHNRRLRAIYDQALSKSPIAFESVAV